MIIPKFWAEAQQQAYSKIRRRKITIRRFGWSDDNPKAAQRHADQRLAEAVQKALSGVRIQKKERAVAYNGEGLPIREEIVRKAGSAVITRNLYGALCLNVENVLFGDIDFKTSAWYGFPFIMAPLLLFLGGEILVDLYFPINFPQLVRLLCIVLLIGTVQLVQFIAKWGFKTKEAFLPKQRASLEKRALGSIARFIKAQPEWHLRVYRTPNGLRLLAMHRTFSPGDAQVTDVFQQLRIDKTYSRMCLNQQCFRARLTPKPWRIGIMSPIPPARGVWPVPNDTLKERKEWVVNYEAISQKFAACKFLKAIGSTSTDRAAVAIQQVHDKESGSDLDLPLA